MADLYIDGAVFARMQANLAHIGDVLDRPGRDLAMLDESCVGAAELRARTGEFGEEWSYGIGQLAKFSGDAAEALAEIDAAFRDVDVQLTRALGPGGTVPVTVSIGGTNSPGSHRQYGPFPTSPAVATAGKTTLGIVKAAGAPTRTVPQWIGPAKELPLGYFQLARQAYPMSQAEFGARFVKYHYSALGNTAAAPGLPGAAKNIHANIRGGATAAGGAR